MTDITILDGTGGVKPSGFYVYIHKRITDGAVMYVGKGKGRRAWSRYHRNRYWNASAKKHGVCVEIYKDGLSEACSLTLEKILTFELKRNGIPLTNLTYGGGGTTGWKHSDEIKAIISMHSKMQVRTEKQMLALRVNDGKTIKPEAKKKMSLAKIREKAPTFDRKIHEFRHSDFGVFVGFQYDFKVKYGLDGSQVSHLLSGRFKSTMGWTYVGERDISMESDGGIK